MFITDTYAVRKYIYNQMKHLQNISRGPKFS